MRGVLSGGSCQLRIPPAPAEHPYYLDTAIFASGHPDHSIWITPPFSQVWFMRMMAKIAWACVVV